MESVFEYIAQDSVKNAEKEVLRLFEEVAKLAKHPAMGRPGRVPETRELIVPPYIIAYRVKENTVQILRVLHSAQM